MQKITQAVILAGGKGERLKPFTIKNPKLLLPVNGKPFIDHLVQLLEENGIKEIIILSGYRSDKVEKHIGNGSQYKAKIKLSYTPFLDENGKENESGLRLKNAEKLLKDYFLLLYCDNYWPLNLKALSDFFEKHPSDVLVTVYSNLDKSTRNNIFIESGFVSKYDPTRTDKDLNSVDIGFFIINKKVLGLLPKTNSKFESVVLPKLIKKRRLAGFLTNQNYYSIGDLERAKITGRFLLPKQVIFLDRDGVINKRPPQADYVKTWEEFEFLPGSIEAIRKLNNNGYKVYIISNQPGIARGALSTKRLNSIHENMLKELKKHAAKIDGIYFCPHGWDEGCLCRKPQPGMLLQASKDHLINLTKTLFIGDDERDQQAGKAAGCKTILVNQKSLLQIVNSLT